MIPKTKNPAIGRGEVTKVFVLLWEVDVVCPDPHILDQNDWGDSIFED